MTRGVQNALKPEPNYQPELDTTRECFQHPRTLNRSTESDLTSLKKQQQQKSRVSKTRISQCCVKKTTQKNLNKKFKKVTRADWYPQLTAFTDCTDTYPTVPRVLRPCAVAGYKRESDDVCLPTAC